MTLIKENIRVRNFEVDQNFVNWRLDQFIAHRISRISRSKASEIIKLGDIEIHRASEKPGKIKPSTKLILGDIIILKEYLPPEEILDDGIEIAYEDDDIIAINKPPGMLVHEAGPIRLHTIVEFLKRRDLPNAHPVHRIDRETSGIVLCGKSKKWVSILRKVFENDRPLKTYRALVLDPQDLWIATQQKTIQIPLGLVNNSLTGLLMGKGTLEAITHIEVLGPHKIGSILCKDLEIIIESGRQHQIRVHLAMSNTPIVGDKLYGCEESAYLEYLHARDLGNDKIWCEENLLIPRHALHAWKLALNIPGKGRVEIETPLPNDLWNSV